MNVWTPEAITNLVIQLVALAGAVTAVIAAIAKLTGKVEENTAVTAAAAGQTVVTAAKVDEIHAATVPAAAPPKLEGGA